MASEVKSLVKHGAIYTVGNILRRGVAFLLIPLYTHYLSPSEYGILELLGLTIDIVATVVGVTMTSAIMRFYYRYEDPDQKSRVVSSALIGTITLMGLAAGICIIMAPSISRLVFESGEYTYFFRLMFVAMFLTSGIEIPMIYLRARLRSVTFIVVNLIKLVIQLSLNIYFLVIVGLGVEGVLLSGLVASALICAYLTVTTFNEVGFRFSFPHYKEMLVFGAPLLIADLSIFALTYADRYFLNYYSDLATVGLYSLAFKFGVIVSFLFNSPFRSIWGAQMFEFAKQDNCAVLFGRVLTYFLLGSLTIGLVLSIFSKDVLRLMADEAYWSAYHIVPIICVTYVLKGVISVTGAGIVIKGRTKYKAVSTSIAMLTALVLNFVLIPLWGGYGAALAGLISMVVRLTIDSFFSQRLFHVVYEWRKIVQVSVLYTIVVLAANQVDIDDLFLSIACNLVILLTFPAAVYIMPILTDNEKETVRVLLKNPMKAAKVLRGGTRHQEAS